MLLDIPNGTLSIVPELYISVVTQRTVPYKKIYPWFDGSENIGDESCLEVLAWNMVETAVLSLGAEANDVGVAQLF